MVPGREASLPRVYGDTPSFLGVPVGARDAIAKGADVVVAGVPWEGTVTWGSFTGCELAPRAIRHASARYGGYLPEHDVDIFDHLNLVDIGDVPVDPNDPKTTMDNVYDAVSRICKTGAVPILFGGDHSFSPEAVRAFADVTGKKVGVIHFDAHMDNAPGFGTDFAPRCSPLYRIGRLEKVDPANIVHLGIRGPRNAPAQVRYARETGSTIFTMRDVRSSGIEKVVDRALKIATDGAKALYVTVCSDCVDAAFNPGGPADFYGLFPHELLDALYLIGTRGFDGLDFVEVYPIQDPNSVSSHLAAWAVIYALAGLAAGRKRKGRPARGRGGRKG